MKRFRGGLVFKAHRLVYHSTLGLRVIKKKEEGKEAHAKDRAVRNIRLPCAAVRLMDTTGYELLETTGYEPFELVTCCPAPARHVSGLRLRVWVPVEAWGLGVKVWA